MFQSCSDFYVKFPKGLSLTLLRYFKKLSAQLFITLLIHFHSLINLNFKLLSYFKLLVTNCALCIHFLCSSPAGTVLRFISANELWQLNSNSNRSGSGSGRLPKGLPRPICLQFPTSPRNAADPKRN